MQGDFKSRPARLKTMAVQFLLFLMTILLLLIFWELSKINSRIKKALRPTAAVPDTSKLKQST